MALTRSFFTSFIAARQFAEKCLEVMSKDEIYGQFKAAMAHGVVPDQKLMTALEFDYLRELQAMASLGKILKCGSFKKFLSLIPDEAKCDFSKNLLSKNLIEEEFSGCHSFLKVLLWQTFPSVISRDQLIESLSVSDNDCIEWHLLQTLLQNSDLTNKPKN